MNKENKIQKIKDAIITAKEAQNKANDLMKRLFDLLNSYDVNLNAKSNSENADELNDAICCFIEYNEYDLNSLLTEIKNAMEED